MYIDKEGNIRCTATEDFLIVFDNLTTKDALGNVIPYDARFTYAIGEVYKGDKKIYTFLDEIEKGIGYIKIYTPSLQIAPGQYVWTFRYKDEKDVWKVPIRRKQFIVEAI